MVDTNDFAQKDDVTKEKNIYWEIVKVYFSLVREKKFTSIPITNSKLCHFSIFVPFFSIAMYYTTRDPNQLPQSLFHFITIVCLLVHLISLIFDIYSHLTSISWQLSSSLSLPLCFVTIS